MLNKIIKYDFRTMWRICAPMFIATGIVSVICCALLYFTLSFSSGENVLAAMMMATGFYVIGIFAIFAMSVICEFVVFYRYYKSMFTDEGYLTMVIPVGTATLLNAKLISSLLFTLIVMAVGAVGIGIAVAIPISLNDPSILVGFFDILKAAIPALSYGSLEAWAIIVMSVRSLFSLVEGVVITISAITVGAILMSRYKILGAICMYLAISFVHSIIVNLSNMLFAFTEGYFVAELLLSNVIGIVISAAFSVVLYILSYNTLKKKLNI